MRIPPVPIFVRKVFASVVVPPQGIIEVFVRGCCGFSRDYDGAPCAWTERKSCAVGVLKIR